MSDWELSDKAKEQFRDIYWDTVYDRGKEQAERYILELEELFDNLAFNPRMGLKREFCPPEYMYFPKGKHNIFFAEKDDGVIEILEVVHSSVELETYFENENNIEKEREGLEKKLEEDRLWRERHRDDGRDDRER